jgi:hypothetical protein
MVIPQLRTAETVVANTPTITNALGDRVETFGISFRPFLFFLRTGYSLTRECVKRVSRSQRVAISRPSSSTGT